MRVGIEGFAIHPLRLAPFKQLEWAASHGFEGLQLGAISGLTIDSDEGPLRELKALAEELNLYTHVSVGRCNPFAADTGERELLKALSNSVSLASSAGWRELHGVLGGPRERYELETSWPDQLTASTRLLRQLAPVLREQGSRVNLETHGDVTTFELIRMVEDVGEDVLGICLDTANVLLLGEHPVMAARRAAPYIHLTHCKDAILYPVSEGLRRQTLPVGKGIIDWKALLTELGACQSEINLSIEDHKWLFDAEIFTHRWQLSNYEVHRDEVLFLVELAHICQSRIEEGELNEPEAYEAIPYADEMEQRLTSARLHLMNVVNCR